MKLLVEKIETVQSLLTEKEGKKSMYLEGVFMQSEVKNRNGRVYPKGIMEGAVSKYIAEKIQNGTAYGELSHPSGPNINPDRVSHIIEELRWDGNNVMGKAKVGGPMGESVLKLMELGGKIGVSSRGLGSLKQNKSGIMEVQNDFRIATAADIVLDPSAPDAYVKGIMEDTEWFYNITQGTWEPASNRSGQEVIAETKTEIQKMSKSQLEERATRLMTNYFKLLSEGKKL
jgi:hypothetical protein